MADVRICDPAGQKALSEALGWVDVRGYEAKGDGVTDDTAAIQAAMAVAISSGKPLYVPPGTYKANLTASGSLASPVQNLVLYGSGFKSKIVAYDIATPVLKLTGNDNSVGMHTVIVRDIWLDGGGNTTTPAMDVSYCQAPKFDRIMVTNASDLLKIGDRVYDGALVHSYLKNQVAGVGGKALHLYGDTNYFSVLDTSIANPGVDGTYGVYISQADTGVSTPINGYHRIKDSHVEGFKYGIFIDKSRGVEIDGNHIEGGSHLATDFVGVLVQTSASANPCWATGIKITNNVFWPKSATLANFIYIDVDGYSSREDFWWGWKCEGNYFGNASGGTTYGLRIDADFAHEQYLRIGTNQWRGDAGSFTTYVNPASTGKYEIADLKSLIWKPGNVSLNINKGNHGHHFSNEGATAVRSFLLPISEEGLTFLFTRIASYNMRIDPNGTEVIRGGGAGKYLSLDTDGATVAIKCVSAGTWEIIATNGTTSFEA